MKKIKTRLGNLTRRQKVLAFLAVLLALWLLFGNRDSAQTISYNTEKVRTSNVVKTITTSGTVQAQKSQTYVFTGSASAKVTEILVASGQTVAAGQVLARMDNSELLTRYIQSRSALNQARNNLDNIKLMGGRSVSYLDIRNLEERVQVAEADYAQAQKNLAGVELKANFAGLVLSVSANVGDLATTMQITVIEPQNYYLEASLAESDVINIKLDMPVNLEVDAFAGQDFAGKVSEITLAPVVTANISSYPIKINLEDTENKLRVGLSADAEIILEQKENVLTIPTAAVISRNGQNFVNKLNNGQLELVPVELGLIGDTQSEVTSGLQLDEEIVVSVIENSGATQGFGFGGGNSNTNTSNAGRNPFRN